MSEIRTLALACKDASQAMFSLDTDTKRKLLHDMASMPEERRDASLAANARDLQQAAAKGPQGAMLDRLRLDESRVAGIAKAVREIAALPHPVGLVTRRDTLANG